MVLPEDEGPAINMNFLGGRLIRRIVRDAFARGTSAEHTIEMWQSVRRGEVALKLPFSGLEVKMRHLHALPF